MLIDTHAHIYSEEFNGESDEVIKRAIGNGVTKILLPNIDSSSIKKMLDLSEKYSKICYPMMGIHPTSVNDDFEEELEVIEYWLSRKKFIAIGEIGIDLYWDKTYREEQEYIFRRQLRLARSYDLPVSVHLRDSYEVVVENIQKEYFDGLKGVFHCFSGNEQQAQEVLSMGFKIGIGGTVTFKNSNVDKVLSSLKPEDIVLETDAPYLSPVPLRGKRNESGNLVFILKKVADIFQMPEHEIAHITSQTATEVFNLDNFN
ncbi:MAG: TatD family hydrolase [Prolixibacteraceae bacterium]|nr:TatD family hydrolase [Prolixibacteraceae bacterium]